DQQRQPANLIFVVDASGSMARENRLGLVKKALRLLVDQLQEGDSVGLVIYESVARVILEPTPAYRRGEILRAIEAIEPGGSTNAGEGLRLGYQLAERRLLRAGINRVILCSDGVANTGVTGSAEILDTIREQADKGITLTTVGFGMGNYNDVLMEQLAQKANGNYYYVDREAQARRVFREQLTGILQTVAKDVKVQVVFDPNTVSRYRLLGYENRHLEASDFANDRVDAGELGSGHTVTALYEVKLRGRSSPLGRLRLRYKPPKGGASRLMDKSLGMYMARDSYADASAPAKLSVAVAAFAEKLRGSYWVRHIGYDDLLRLHGQIPDSLRGRADVNELRQLMYTARRLDRRGDKFQDEVPLSQMSFDHVPILR
ncbi:MAG: DUF3520 domain-containing protein, partial [Gammaproteobacteria bacterium]|nr:DUF3520 domain-containing protein [Gammaproteobacteria bacterium]